MQPASESPAVDQEAPDFKVETPLHGTVALSQFHEKKSVVLVFFRAFAMGNRMQVAGLRLVGALCPTCHMMLMDLARHYQRVQDLGAEILAISTIKERELARVLQAHEPKFPLGADEDGSITRRYGVFDALWRHPKPAAFLIDRVGIIRYRHVAEQQTDLPRAAELVQRLEQL